MRVLLMDFDIKSNRRPFPNLALMKLSAYHKARGDEVFLNFPLCQPDITYASCVFSWHKPKTLDPSFIIGGSGINLSSILPNEIEHIMPDYSLSGLKDIEVSEHWYRDCIKVAFVYALASNKGFYIWD